MQRVAILDTSIIATWVKLLKWNLNIFDLLPSIASQVLIPQEVKREIENYAPESERPEQIQWVLRKIDENIFFKLCSTFDTIDLDFLKSLNKVDGGEAEALAQGKKIDCNWIWIDDKKCLPELEKHLEHFHFHNSIILLNILHQSRLLPDSENAFKKLHRA